MTPPPPWVKGLSGFSSREDAVEGSQESSSAGKPNTLDALQLGLQTMTSLPLSGAQILNKGAEQRAGEAPAPA